MRTLGNILLVCIYVGGIVLANFVVTMYGQVALPFTAFFLIPLDLVVRDLIQDRLQPNPITEEEQQDWNYVNKRLTHYGFAPLRRKHQNEKDKLWFAMAHLIFGGSAISYLTATGSLRIVVASSLAFLLTGLIDAFTYQKMIRLGRMFRINAATIIAAITDSWVFAAVAFEHYDTDLVGLQALTKILGGFCWSVLLYRLFRRNK